MTSYGLKLYDNLQVRVRHEIQNQAEAIQGLGLEARESDQLREHGRLQNHDWQTCPATFSVKVFILLLCLFLRTAANGTGFLLSTF
jgi:hypothetical protein